MCAIPKIIKDHGVLKMRVIVTALLLSILVAACAKTKEERFNENFDELTGQIDSKASEIQKQVSDKIKEQEQNIPSADKVSAPDQRN